MLYNVTFSCSYSFTEKSEKTERTRISGAVSKEIELQSPWGYSMPKEILLKIFEYVVDSEGTLPSVIRYILRYKRVMKSQTFVTVLY